MFDIKISYIYEKKSNKTMDIINVNCIVQIGEDVFYVLAIFLKRRIRRPTQLCFFVQEKSTFHFCVTGGVVYI